MIRGAFQRALPAQIVGNFELDEHFIVKSVELEESFGVY